MEFLQEKVQLGYISLGQLGSVVVIWGQLGSSRCRWGSTGSSGVKSTKRGQVGTDLRSSGVYREMWIGWVSEILGET
jgi:hypothetical protein